MSMPTYEEMRFAFSSRIQSAHSSAHRVNREAPTEINLEYLGRSLADLSDAVSSLAYAADLRLAVIEEELSNAAGDAGPPVASKSVRAVTPCTLELDGQRHDLAAGDSLEVPGLAVRMMG